MELLIWIVVLAIFIWFIRSYLKILDRRDRERERKENQWTEDDL